MITSAIEGKKEKGNPFVRIKDEHTISWTVEN